jgi:hypothetical protein
MQILLIILGLACASLAAADDPGAEVRQAFAAVNHDYRSAWAYTETRLENDVTMTGRYDPRRNEGERWTLLTVDGRQPTAAEIEKFHGEKNDGADDDSDEYGLGTIRLDTLELVEDTDSHRVYSFEPAIDVDADKEERAFMDQVRGRVSIAKDGGYPEYLELTNQKPIRPRLGVRFSRFHALTTFGRIGDDGPVVRMKVDVELEGRALLVINIDEKESITYTDFEYVGG